MTADGFYDPAGAAPPWGPIMRRLPPVADLHPHDPKVTLATYAHVILGVGEQAAAALSAALLG